MFPGPGAQVYYNDAGEPLGWDYPSDEPYEPDDQFFDNYERDEDDDKDDEEHRITDDDAADLANDVEHFYARNADHLDPSQRALLANAVKLIRKFA